jgi:hypothetical protein
VDTDPDGARTVNGKGDHLQLQVKMVGGHCPCDGSGRIKHYSEGGRFGTALVHSEPCPGIAPAPHTPKDALVEAAERIRAWAVRLGRVHTLMSREMLDYAAALAAESRASVELDNDEEGASTVSRKRPYCPMCGSDTRELLCGECHKASTQAQAQTVGGGGGR